MAKTNGTIGNQCQLEDCLIYKSTSQGYWVAHGLHTDQIGTGDCVLDAYVDYLVGIRNLKKLQEEDCTIEIKREAPKEILKRAEKARPLPEELYQVAHRRLCGTWPNDIKVVAEPRHNHPLKVLTGQAA